MKLRMFYDNLGSSKIIMIKIMLITNHCSFFIKSIHRNLHIDFESKGIMGFND